ncbi:MAG: sulfotransferase family protein [Pseudomonadota bacterium]
MRAQDAASPHSPGPLFIIGCGRSGTTLLRLMLNAHSAFAIPEESHFIYHLARDRAAGRYRKGLNDEKTWAALLDYFENHSFVQRWGLAMPALMARLRALPQHSFKHVFATIFAAYREQQGKPLWGDKTPMHVNYMFLVRRFFPNARFLHIIRDGREVAMSLLTRTWGPRHINHAGYYWKWLVLAGLVGGHLMGPARYRQIRYEDLVRDPEGVLRAVSA